MKTGKRVWFGESSIEAMARFILELVFHGASYEIENTDTGWFVTVLHA